MAGFFSEPSGFLSQAVGEYRAGSHPGSGGKARDGKPHRTALLRDLTYQYYCQDRESARAEKYQ